ncbi:MAG: tetratricopeptide repeat protein [Candidatus Neomarinimicrobiota bacterium]
MQLKQVHYIIILLFFLVITLRGQRSSEAIAVADSLISEGKYWSAIGFLYEVDPDDTNPTISLKKQEIAFEYYIYAVGGSIFSLSDFVGPIDITLVRGKAGEYQAVVFRSDSVFTSIISQYPERWEGPYGLGMYYYWCSNNCGCCLEGCEGLIPRAADYFLDAQRLGADDSHSHFVIGLNYHYQGNLEEAVRCYNLSIERDSDFPTSHYNLALAQLSLGNVQDALKPARAACTLYTDKHLKADAVSLLGSILKDLGNIPEAIKAYSSALAIDPHHATSINLILLLMFELNDWDGAFDVTLRYIQEAPSDYQTYQTIIQPWYRSSKPLNIIDVMDQALAPTTDVSERSVITFFCAEFLKVLGEPGKALERYELADKLLLDAGDAHLDLLEIAQEQITKLRSNR